MCRKNITNHGWLLVVAAWLAAQGAQAFCAEPTAAEQRKASRHKIETMPAAERARLQRNFEQFKELPAAERDRLRDVHRQIQEDKVHGHGELEVTLDKYMHWLVTLSPGEKADLRKEPNPAVREKQVREILKEQRNEIDLASSRRLAWERDQMSSADLDAVLGELEQHIRDKRLRSAKQLAELDGKEGLARHVAIWNLAFNPEGPQGAAPPVFTQEEGGELTSRLIEKISDEKQKKMVLETNNPWERGARFFKLVFFGMMKEFQSIQPSDEELEKFFATLPIKQQDEIMKLPADRQKWEINRHFIDAHPERFPKFPWQDRHRMGGRRGGFFGWGPPPGQRKQEQNEKKQNPPRPPRREKGSPNDRAT